jgi:3-phenylpropionate/cinnamic acid dioxygenase small subunit
VELVAEVARTDVGDDLSERAEKMTTSTQAAAVAAPGETRAPHRPNRVPLNSEAYARVAEFLYEEALLLDDLRLVDWTGLLTEDLIYTAPLRQTRHFSEHQLSIVRSVKHFDETYNSIMSRVGRLTESGSAWAEDPPSRTRRLVTNILVDATDNPDEFDVTSYVLLARSRFEESDMGILSMVRYDRLRMTGGRLKLARREIIIDQSVLGMPNLAVFL